MRNIMKQLTNNTRTEKYSDEVNAMMNGFRIYLKELNFKEGLKNENKLYAIDSSHIQKKLKTPAILELEATEGTVYWRRDTNSTALFQTSPRRLSLASFISLLNVKKKGKQLAIIGKNLTKYRIPPLILLLLLRQMHMV